MEGKTRRGDIVKNIMIFPELPLCPEFNPGSSVHQANKRTPEMRIRGEINGKVWWWDIEGRYYHHREPRKDELLLPRDFHEDPWLRLEIKED